ncbi:MAG: tRNA lysidine(34) synthetase TilS [Planctomycetes bacterium]|nr:tRNA lysidine(34) synthetase TilS [Planctomycetota bacterium]NBY02201.1 tRNA lysidine(34) synthetase TilS [Planctomycetota bacterium]
MKPRSANSPVLLEVKSFLASCKNANSGIIVGVSGGADSMGLAHALACQIKKESVARLIVAHVNHASRGEENDLDEVLIRHFVGILQGATDALVEYTSVKLNSADLNIGASWEKNARVARYNWFSKIALENNVNWVFTAHTSNDQAETVLMRILRGSGVQGLAGIKPKRSLISGVSLGRPLLFCSKEQICDYLRDNNIVWREDPTNQQTRFLRNKIRLDLLPLLKNEFQPAIEGILAGLAGHIQAYASFEKRLARKIGLKLEKPRVLDQVVLDRVEVSKFPAWKLSLFLRSIFARELWPTDAIHHKQWKKIAQNLGTDGFEVHLVGGIRIQSNRYTVVLGPT